MLPVQGMGYGPQGQDDFRRRLQPENQPSAYSNAAIHSRIDEYTLMKREVYGPQYDPSTRPLDGEVIMRVGGYKKHGRY